MANHAHSTNRRAFLRTSAAGVAFAVGAAPALAQCMIPAHNEEPLAAMIRAYRDEDAVVQSFPGDIPEDFEHAAFMALTDYDLPPARSRAVALDALRLAIEFGKAHADASVGLTAAALAYFEASDAK